MPSEPFDINQFGTWPPDALRWIHVKIGEWGGCDAAFYTDRFENAHINFLCEYRIPASLNILARAFIYVRKLGKPEKDRLGMVPYSDRPKHGRRLRPSKAAVQ